MCHLRGRGSTEHKTCIYGARQKNLQEDKFIILAAKCRPMILVARKVYADMCGGSIGEGASSIVSANGLQTYRVA